MFEPIENDTVDAMIGRLFQYSNTYDRNDPVDVQRARDMMDAAGLLRYYVDEDRKKLEEIKDEQNLKTTKTR